MAEPLTEEALPEASESSLARVRVFARTAGKERVPMLGLVSREALAALKKRFAGASSAAPGQAHFAARVKRIDAVRVTLARGQEPIPGRLVVLELTTQKGAAKPSTRSRGLQRELEDLVALAARLKEAEPASQTAGA